MKAKFFLRKFLSLFFVGAVILLSIGKLSLVKKTQAWFSGQASLDLKLQTGDWLPPETQVACPESAAPDCLIEELIANGSFIANLDSWQKQTESTQLTRMTNQSVPLPDNFPAAVQLEFTADSQELELPAQVSFSQLLAAQNSTQPIKLGFWFWLVSDEDLTGFDLPTFTVSLGDQIIYQAQAPTDSWQVGLANLPPLTKPAELKFALHNTGDKQNLPKLLLTGVTTKVVLLPDSGLSLRLKTNEQGTQTHLLYLSNQNTVVHQVFDATSQTADLPSSLSSQVSSFWSVDQFGQAEIPQNLLVLASVAPPSKPQIFEFKRSQDGRLALMFLSNGNSMLNLATVEVQASFKAITADLAADQLEILDSQFELPFLNQNQTASLLNTPLSVTMVDKASHQWLRLRVKDTFGRFSEYSDPYFLVTQDI